MLSGPVYGLDTIIHADLFINIINMRLHRMRAQEYFVGDVLTRVTAYQRLQYFYFFVG